MKTQTATLMFLLLSFIASAGCVGYCSDVGNTANYDITLVEKQAAITKVVVSSPVMGISNYMSYEIINVAESQVRFGEPNFHPVKAKGLISAYFVSCGKRDWLIPFKITPGSKAYEYFADVGKTTYFLSDGCKTSLLKIPLKA